jgi:hypothetical protein
VTEQQQHGRFFAQELMLDQSGNIREQIQDALDAGESQEKKRLLEGSLLEAHLYAVISLGVRLKPLCPHPI